MVNLEWGGIKYASYTVYLKKSSQETHTFGSMQFESQNLMNYMQQQWASSRAVLNALTPQLQAIFQNPPGFGATALASMKSQLIQNLGGMYAGQQQALNQQFSTENMAGLGSGPFAAITANAQEQMFGQEASGLANINIANAQQQNQQQQWAGGMLQQQSQLLNQTPTAANMLGQSLNQQFNAANLLNQQGTFLSNMASAGLTALGGAAGFMVGGPMGAQLGAGLGGAIGGSFGGGGGGGGMLPGWGGGGGGGGGYGGGYGGGGGGGTNWGTFNWGGLGLPTMWGGPTASSTATNIGAGVNMGPGGITGPYTGLGS